MEVAIYSFKLTPTIEGQYSLTCTVSGIDLSQQINIQYSWLKMDLRGMSETLIDASTSTLTFSSFMLSDVGLYKCMVMVKASVMSSSVVAVSDPFKVDVSGEPICSYMIKTI